MASDLFDKESNWTVVALALGAPPLTPEETKFMDAVAAAVNAADPRIWPLKLIWIASSFGSPMAGLAAANALLEEAEVGPWPVRAAATWLLQLVRESPDGGPNLENASRWLRWQLAQSRRLAGLGVLGRQEDERVKLLREAVHRYGYGSGRCWRAFDAVDAALALDKKLRPNVMLAFSAIALDRGFDPDQAPLLLLHCFQAMLLANARDAGRLRPPSLQRLPSSAVVYVGPTRRISPRALRALAQGGAG